MTPPDPANYWAEWNVTPVKGSRKASKSLWIYENETGKKRYSVTTSAGVKIQPYFDIPSPKDPNFYFFRVQGETLENDLVRLWVTGATARELRSLVGSLDTDAISSAVLNAIKRMVASDSSLESGGNVAESIVLTKHAYGALTELEAVSDEHRIQLLIRALKIA